MEISAETRVTGLIGYPVRHSLSPVILNAAFDALDLDWRYVAFEVEPGLGAAAVAAMRSLHIEGLSVTMPHKQAVAQAVDSLTPVAAALEAVNCVYWEGGRLVGDNTDGAGFIDSLRREREVDVAGMRCVVIGAGGAGRAVCRALGDAGASDVAVVNRTLEKAELAAQLVGHAGRVGSEAAVADAHLVINATSIGMAGSGSPDDVPLDPQMLRSDQVVVDLVYHPFTTPLLASAAQRGATTLNGLPMLVHQAAHALHRWTSKDAPIAAMTSAALRAIH